LLLPSGNTVTIREQNGNDDDIISSFISGDEMIGPINRFLAGLIVDHSFEGFKSKSTILPTEILELLLRDKYFILMASRIFSISDTIIFSWDWKNGKPPVKYEEELLPYLWDYNKEFPQPGDPEYFKYRIAPYTEQKTDTKELVLKSGKKVRYGFLNGHGENYLLNIADDNRTINAGLKARGLELWQDGEWIKVENFKEFKAYEMASLRDSIEKEDKQFDGLTDITNPYSGEVLAVPMLSIQDFFFPREI